jgi:hypothetical protein
MPLWDKAPLFDGGDHETAVFNIRLCASPDQVSDRRLKWLKARSLKKLPMVLL